jgi:ribosomal protein L11 methyltransferase
VYFALHIDVSEEASELVQAVLDTTGPLGLEVRDRTLKLHPAVSPPPPGRVQILAYYEGEHEVDEAARQVRREFPEAGIISAPLAEEDWSETWKKHVRAAHVGRIWVGPSWLLEKAGDAPLKLVIEPGMAFGTGDHPTTALCLQAIQDAVDRKPEASVLDVGTGTGVLAIAARRLGAKRVVANDIDPAAVRIAAENAGRNGASGIEFTDRPLERISGEFDVVVANLFAGVICQLAPRLAAHLAPNGLLLLTGILAPQAPEVTRAIDREGLAHAGKRVSGEWVLLRFEKR